VRSEVLLLLVRELIEYLEGLPGHLVVFTHRGDEDVGCDDGRLLPVAGVGVVRALRLWRNGEPGEVVVRSAVFPEGVQAEEVVVATVVGGPLRCRSVGE
jgi:hypothetical protein